MNKSSIQDKIDQEPSIKTETSAVCLEEESISTKAQVEQQNEQPAEPNTTTNNNAVAKQTKFGIAFGAYLSANNLTAPVDPFALAKLKAKCVRHLMRTLPDSQNFSPVNQLNFQAFVNIFYSYLHDNRRPDAATLEACFSDSYFKYIGMLVDIWNPTPEYIAYMREMLVLRMEETMDRAIKLLRERGEKIITAAMILEAFGPSN